jgi:hypothetical protein
MLQRTAPLSTVDWSRRFADPIPVQNRKPLATLRDAASYITELPKAEQEAPAWHTAAELLMLIAEQGGDLMMARIAMMRALHRREPRSESAQRRKRVRRFTITR